MLLVFAHTRRVASRASRLPSRRVSRDVPPHPPPRASGARTPRRARRRRAGARPRRGGTRGRPPRPRRPRRTGPARRPTPGARAGGPTRWGLRARAPRVTRRARVCRAHATHAAVSPRARRAPARATDTPSRLSVHHEGFRVKKPLFSVSSDGPSPSGPSGVVRSHARVFRTDMFCVWARFFGASSAVHESQTVEYPFFATCAREKIEAPTPSIAARSPRVDRLMNAARVTGLATSNVRLRRAAIIRDTASPNEQQNPRPRAMSSTWAQ